MEKKNFICHTWIMFYFLRTVPHHIECFWLGDLIVWNECDCCGKEQMSPRRLQIGRYTQFGRGREGWKAVGAINTNPNSTHGRQIKRSGSFRRSKKQQKIEMGMVKDFPHEWNIVVLQHTNQNHNWNLVTGKSQGAKIKWFVLFSIGAATPREKLQLVYLTSVMKSVSGYSL